MRPQRQAVEAAQSQPRVDHGLGVASHPAGSHGMKVIGVELAKRVFQIHGAAADGSVIFRRKVSRGQFVSFLADQPHCLVAMEACATAHNWAREIERLGHTVRLIPPTYVNRS